jgi:hypothetical protein
MIAERRLLGLLLFGLFIVMGNEASTFGQPDFFPDQTEVEEIDEEAPAVQNAALRAQNMVINDMFLYQRGIEGCLSLRQTHEARLRIQINQTCKAYRLSDLHRRKLKIAGMADILSFQHNARTLQAMYLQLNSDKERFEEFQEEFRRLLFAESGYPFRNAHCLYVKVLNRILKTEGITPRAIVFLDDVAAVNALDEVEYYSSLVETVANALPPEMALRDKKQRIQLAEMLRQELQTKPRIRTEDAELAWQHLAQIPPERWNQILDEKQWMALKGKFDK